MTIYIIVMILIVLAVALTFSSILFGFWMGRQTLEKKIMNPPNKTGGQPVFEQDPYADALRTPKIEGGL
jgi:hypothetical protein